VCRDGDCPFGGSFTVYAYKSAACDDVYEALQRHRSLSSAGYGPAMFLR